jgi:ribosomal protein S17
MRSVDPTPGPAFRLREIRRVHACGGRSRLVERSNGSGAVRTIVVRIHSKHKHEVLQAYQRTGRSFHRKAMQKGRKSAALSIGDAATSVEAVPYTHRD